MPVYEWEAGGDSVCVMCESVCQCMSGKGVGTVCVCDV